MTNRRYLVPWALLALYVVWGSTYLAMRFAIEGFPPFMMAGIRFVIAGGLFILFLRLRGAAWPNRRQWASTTVVGGLLLLGGNGAVAYAEQWIGSGVAALAIATVPLWTVLFSEFWGHRSSRREWLGILIGFVGVGLLSLGADMQASAAGALALLFAAASWSFGSVWSKHLPMPAGMMSSATQMFCGGLLLMATSFALGEHLGGVPSLKALASLGYLIVFGSFIAYTSYQFLLHTVSPALATSYAYVNPVVAVALGAWLAGEKVGVLESAAMAVIVAGVVLVVAGGKKTG
ncbi:MAG: drug/metabolite exporter YedA [Sulfuricella sp.]|nr:drug/metabolite exporter YedA [Sulfuricella sp.]